MNAGEWPARVVAMGPAGLRRTLWLARGLLWALMVVATPAWALDNPDAPDYAAEFRSRALPLEDQLADSASGPGAAAAAAAYAKFLDAELNQAYRVLLEQVGGDSRGTLMQSQRQWLRFRDAEVRFVDLNWTPQNFGSSSSLSRAEYRAALVKARVLTLLEYLRNYSVAGKR